MRAAFILTVSSSIQQHNARSYTDGSRFCTCSNWTSRQNKEYLLAIFLCYTDWRRKKVEALLKSEICWPHIFDDYSCFGFYNSIRQGRVSGDPKVVDLVQLKYENDIQYKLNQGTDDTWRMFPHHIDSTIHIAQIPAQLYNSSLPIFKSKWMAYIIWNM